MKKLKVTDGFKGRGEYRKKNFQYSDAVGVDFRGATIVNCRAQGVRWVNANFRLASITWSNFQNVELRDSNFVATLLSRVDFTDAKLSGVDFKGSSIRHVNFLGANLTAADFTDAILSNVNFFGADLSGAKGLPDGSELIRKLERTEDGFIVYKVFSDSARSSLYRAFPPYWPDLKEGAVLEEVCNPDRTLICGCGVNFGTREYCSKLNWGYNQTWRCLIEWNDTSGIVVPYSDSDFGAARCSRLHLIERVEQ